LQAQGDLTIQGDVVGRDKIGLSGAELEALLARLARDYQPRPFDGRNPYVGLRAFGQGDAHLFFGRDVLIATLRSRLDAGRVVVVAGRSGSGKSSLLRAGLAATLTAQTPAQRAAFLNPGRDPVEQLAQAASRIRGNPAAGDYLRTHAAAQPEALAKTLSAQLDEPSGRLLLVIDQLEELFTQVESADVRALVARQLRAVVEHGDPRLRLALGVRSDFLAECSQVPDLNALINTGFVQIGDMGPGDLVSAIAGPAAATGLRLDPLLVAQVLADVGREPAPLPLLQFALADLFDSSSATGSVQALTLSAYIQRGGVTRALARHADAVLTGLTPEQQVLAGTIFTSLIQVEDEGRHTRRLVTPAEIPIADAQRDDFAPTLEHLLASRLLTQVGEVAGEPTISLAHERLITAWPWLQALLVEQREQDLLARRILDAAGDWVRDGRDPSHLPVASRLAVQVDTAPSRVPVSEQAAEYLSAGRAWAVRDVARLKRSRLILQALFGAALVGVVVALLSWYQASRAEHEAVRQAEIANASLLAAAAQLEVAQGFPQRAILLAAQASRLTEAAGLSPLPELETILRSALEGAPDRAVFLGTEPVTVVQGQADLHLLRDSAWSRLRWEASGQAIETPVQSGLVALGAAPDGRTVYGLGTEALYVLADAQTTPETVEYPPGFSLPAGTVQARLWVGDTVLVAGLADGDTVIGSRVSEGHGAWQVVPGCGAPEQASIDEDWILTTQCVIRADSDAVVRLPDHKEASLAAAAPRLALLESSAIVVYDLEPVWRELARRPILNVDQIVLDARGETVFMLEPPLTLSTWAVGQDALVAILSRVRGLAISPDGTRLAAWRADDVQLFDLTEPVTALPGAVLAGHAGPIVGAAFSPEGRWLATWSHSTPGGTEPAGIRVWDMWLPLDEVPQAPRVLGLLEDEISTLQFAPTGDQLVAVDRGPSLRAWALGGPATAAGGTVLAGSRLVLATGDGQRLATHDLATGDLSIWSLAGPRPSDLDLLARVPYNLTWGVALDEDSATWALTDWSTVLLGQPGADARRLVIPDGVQSLALVRGSDQLVVVTANEVLVYAVAEALTGAQTEPAARYRRADLESFRLTDDWFAAYGSGTGALELWRLAQPGLGQRRYSGLPEFDTLDLSPDSMTLVGNDTVARSAWLARLPDEGGPVTVTRLGAASELWFEAALTGNALVSVAGDAGSLLIWPASAGPDPGSPIALTRETTTVTAILGASPDGRWAVIGDPTPLEASDSAATAGLYQLDLEARVVLRQDELLGLRGQVSAVAIQPASHWLAVATQDRLLRQASARLPSYGVRIWAFDADTGLIERQILQGHRSGPNDLRFDPLGRWLISASDGLFATLPFSEANEVRSAEARTETIVWDLDPGALLTWACQVVGRPVTDEERARYPALSQTLDPCQP
jgi:WD40 repeat protein